MNVILGILFVLGIFLYFWPTLYKIFLKYGEAEAIEELQVLGEFCELSLSGKELFEMTLQERKEPISKMQRYLLKTADDMFLEFESLVTRMLEEADLLTSDAIELMASLDRERHLFYQSSWDERFPKLIIHYGFETEEEWLEKKDKQVYKDVDAFNDKLDDWIVGIEILSGFMDLCDLEQQIEQHV